MYERGRVNESYVTSDCLTMTWSHQSPSNSQTTINNTATQFQYIYGYIRLASSTMLHLGCELLSMQPKIQHIFQWVFSFQGLIRFKEQCSKPQVNEQLKVIRVLPNLGHV